MSLTDDRPNTIRARPTRRPPTVQGSTGRATPYTYTYKARTADRSRLRFETEAVLDPSVGVGRPRPRADGPSYRDRLIEQERRVLGNPARRGFGPFSRLRLILAVVAVIALVLVKQLFTLQITDNKDLIVRADDLHIQSTTTQAQRGQIRDANGMLLATSVPIYRLYISPCGPSAKANADSVAQIAPLLPKVAPADLVAAFDNTPCDGKALGLHNLIASGVDADTADKIMALGRPGVESEAYSQRQYPDGTLAAQTLGFANLAGDGAYGLEGQYDTVLKGTPAQVRVARDRSGNPIPGGDQQIGQPVDGKDLNLTLDATVQAMVERELQKGISDHKADNGMAMVMDPRTGAIIAAAAFPTFDPNSYATTDPQLFRNPLVNDIFEPGSTFKILTASAGIDTGAVTPDSWADLPGCVIKKGWPICNYNKVGYNHQTVTDTLIHSSNVGAMWIVDKLKPETYYDYLKRFGIGSQTGVDLAGEADGLVIWPTNKSWDSLDMENSAFGQNTAVSPLQLVTAVSAVANGGTLMKPYIVQSITKDGVIYSQHTPQVVRQVIAPGTAAQVAKMLEATVECIGESRFAHVDGYNIAGKTGTAQIATNGYYEDAVPGHTRGSTIAWPVDDPRFVVFVRLDRTKDIQFGSNTAAPVVQAITKQLLTYYRMPPTPGAGTCTYHH